MKRKFIFLAASAAIFLCACSNQEDFLVRGEVNVDQQVGHQTDDVTASDIGTVVSEFFGGQRTRGVDYDTSAITDASGNAAIYVVNYKDNQGFLLISATKRYCPVLAYADKGNFDVSGIADSGSYSQLATAKLLICRKKTSFGVSKFSFLRGLRLILC